jgi:aldehyde dehydrogenase (NAD+)
MIHHRSSTGKRPGHGGPRVEVIVTEVWHEQRMLIDGELVGAASGRTFDDVDPATEDVIGVAADGDRADLDAAVAAARRAFDETGWSTDLGLRTRVLRQFHEALVRHGEAFRATVTAEIGAPTFLTTGPQFDTPVDGVRWYADLAERYAWVSDLGAAELYGFTTHRRLLREPVGVVAAITPWNFPVQINLAKVVPALAAGNTVVLKPAPDSPWCATLLGRLLAEETDLPPGVLNVVTSSDHAIGQRLAEDHRVDLVSFTGSTATGRRVMVAAAGNLKRVFLELGGKSAAVALDEDTLANAASTTVMQVMTHAGQGCAITTRLVVPRALYDTAVGIAVETMTSLPYGDPTEPGVMMGPLISERQRRRVLGYVRTGVEEGATVATGGGVPAHLERGFFVEPTILTDVERDATVAQEEIFGPVLVVQAHDGDDDAVAVANDSVYGLSGAVFSASNDRARAFAARVRTGTMSINGGIYYGADVPFGGYKQSGIGREMGVQGFEEYLETKALAELI